MPKAKMDLAYFEEKKEYAIEGVSLAQGTVEDVKNLLAAWNYELPELINATEIHEIIRVGKEQLNGALINFEKLRWASAKTDLEFNDWLREQGHPELVRSEH